MNINELVSELKEVALKLNQVKHYVTKNNIPLPDGMPPILALMHHHESLENELQRVHRIKRLPSGSFSVPLPTNVEEARAMATVGTQWLMDNAPSELTHPWQMYGAAKKQNDEMAALLADINEYCQQNNIGTIGDSSSKALMTHHKALIEGKLAPVYQWREIGETDWVMCNLLQYQVSQTCPHHDTKIIYAERPEPVSPGTPLGGCAVKDPSKCRIETDGECGCAFGQCANGLIF